MSIVGRTGAAWMVEVDTKAMRNRVAMRECCMTLEGFADR